jgi:hypothetical protein
MNIITDKAELNKFIDSIATRGKKLDHDIHVAACSALTHLGDHGDIGFVNRLFLALPKGARKAAMTSWLLTHGALKANTEGDKATKPFVFDKTKTTDVEAGKNDPWFDHKPDQAPDTVFDLQAALMGVLKKAQGKELVHGHLLDQIKELAESIQPAEGEDLTPAAE